MKPQIIDRPLVITQISKAKGNANLTLDENNVLSIAVPDQSELEAKAKALKTEAIDEIKKLAEGMIASEVKKIDELIQALMKHASKLADEGIEAGLKKRKAQFAKGKWHGEDLGSDEDPIIDVFSKGQFKGLRLENVPGLQGASGKSVGRVCLNTSDEHVYVDLGNRQKRVSLNKLEIEVRVADPKAPIVVVCEKGDATKMVIQVSDCSDDFKRIAATIKTPSAKKIVIELPEGAQVGTYRIVGME